MLRLLTATALAMLLSVAMTGTAHAIEKVSDAELKRQMGAQAKYYTGQCENLGGYICTLNPAYNAACTILPAGAGYYRDVAYNYKYCSGSRVYNGTGPCQSNRSSTTTVERRNYSLAASVHCWDTAPAQDKPANYTGSTWLCSHGDCRPPGSPAGS
jgi:hypothetical protein